MIDRPRLAILGGSFSGNKGAAAMAHAVADGVRSQVPAVEVVMFSPYPSEDRRLQSMYEIVDFTPRRMLTSLPAAALSLLSGHRWIPHRGAAGALARSRAVADVSGVSFMDGRGVLTWAYNILLVLLPWALGVPVVKVAQAVGPVRSPHTRFFARTVLGRVQWIGLRGAGTASNADGLGLSNAEPAADVAFLLQVGESDTAAAQRILPNDLVSTVVVPSVVVEEACTKAGIDYLGRMVKLVDRLTEAGHEVVIVAHSARQDGRPGRTNDLPLCRRLGEASTAKVIDDELDARVLRALIGRSRLLITSRFHAMISGLATGRPTFVVGWSHKYREVLADFGLKQWATDFRQLTDADLTDQVMRLDHEAAEVRDRLKDALPAVLASAQRSVDKVVEAMEGGL